MKITLRLAAATIAAAALLCLPMRGAENLSRFRNMGTREGLSDDNISSIYQDEFGVVWIGTGDGLNRYDGRTVQVLRPGLNDSTTIYNNNIRRICGDRNGKIYVISKYALNEYDLATERFRLIKERNMHHICCNRGRLWAASRHTVFRLEDGKLEKFITLDGSTITCLLEMSDGRILIGTEADGAFAVDENRKVFKYLQDTNISNLYEDSKHNLWLATRYNGLYKFSPGNKVTAYRHSDDPGSISDDYVRCICEDGFGQFWIGTFNGLCVLDPDSRQIRRVSKENFPASSIWDIICDDEGSVWIGSHYGGVSIWSKELDSFENYDFYGNIIEDGGEGLYIASENDGLLHYDTKTGVRTSISGIGEHGLKSLYYDTDSRNLWIGTLRAGMFRMNRNGTFRRYPFDADDPEAIPSEHIHKIVPYGADSLIIATKKGVVMFSKENGKCRKLFGGTAAEGKYVSGVMVDDSCNCWVALSGAVCRTDLHSGESREYFTAGSVPELGTSNIQTLFQDREGRIWLGSTGRGLFLYDKETESFTSINSSNSALPNDYIIDINQSPSGYLLLTTNSGFSRYDCDNRIFFNYNQDNGYPIPDANPYGILVTSGNKIYLSGFGHTIAFYENDLAKPARKSDIWFVSLNVNNHKVSPGDGMGILQKSLFYQDSVTLKPAHNMFSVECSPIEYMSDVNKRFEYRLDGFDKEWISGKWNMPLTYTNLPPKDYVLEARVLDSQTGKELAHRNLYIKVKPHFYQTLWFYVAVAALVLLIVIFCVRTYTAHLKLNASLEFEKLEKKKIQELNGAKMRFFTYISHEIRTPVTLMTSSVESLLSQQGLAPSIYSKLKGIRDNLGKVSRLINELLDFRKQENDMSHMRFSENDIVFHLAKTEANFREYAQQKHINFSFDNRSDKQRLPVWYDYEQIDKVLTNLLSNAFKHTGKGGSITLILEQADDMAVIRVSDNGEGIAPTYQKMIFEPFGQVPGKGEEALGTGLGLALSQKIIEAHKGIIKVNSDLGKGATFTIKLPLGNEHIPEDARCTRPDEDAASLENMGVVDEAFIEEVKASREKSGLGKVKMLIVEDNDDLRNSLADLMEPFFHITLAKDGQDAIEKMEHSLPDIILSDLMMPGIDGNELCSRVKKNIETSHIPFVMLTAKISAEAEVEGFINGADDYIAKPFNAKVLISKCNNLVNSRALLQKRFIRSVSIESSSELAGENSIDKRFMEKALKVIEEHLTDPEFDIKVFAHEMAMGRTSFFMKIKGITGQTPNKFISNMRLKKSVELMTRQPELSVSEIAYMVGFSSPSYFIKQFRELYGTTPSSYKNRND